MSKSIKDYKDAMDNIKISDSFYKRTENMLTELSEVKIEKKSSFGGGKLTAGIMAAAACAVCVIGLRIALDGRDVGIDTTVTQSIIETIEETAPELIDEIENEEELFADLADPTSGEEGSPDGGAAVGNDTYESIHETAAETPIAEDKPVPLSVPEDRKTEFTAMTVPPVESAVPEQGGAYTGGDGYPDISVQGYENIPMMDDISLENVIVEVTPYFDMGTIKSGEGAVKKNGTEFASVIDFISDVAASSTEISNYSFRTIFSMRIADENIGVTFYSIYLTDSDTLVITKHSADIQQRVTYVMESADYDNLMHTLFLMFGSEDDYQLFKSLISGK